MKSADSPAALKVLAVSLLVLAPALPAVEPPVDRFEDVSILGTIPVRELVEAPSDPRRIYLWTLGGSLLRSDDAGARFSAEGLANLPEGGISGIVVHPHDPDELFLLGAFFDLGSLAVFRSTDAGRTLKPFPLPPDAVKLWIEPQPPYRRFSARAGRLVAQEAGGPWLELPEIVPGEVLLSVEHLAFDPHQAGHLLAAAASGIYESRDDGLTWSLRVEGSFIWLGFDPFVPGRVWAQFFEGEGILWRSFDGGSTWIETPPISLNDTLRLDFDPHRPGYLLLTFGHRHVVPTTTRLSRDGGATWEDLALPADGHTYRIWSLRDGRWILAFQDIEAARWLESADAGASWLPRKVLPSPVLALAVDPQDPEHAWAADETGVYRTTRGGASWQPVFTPGFSLRYKSPRLAVDPEDNRVVFLAHSRDGWGPSVWRSSDRGRTWYDALIKAGDTGLTSFEIGRTGQLSFLLALYDTAAGPLLWRSTDHGATWQSREADSPSALAVDPESGVVYQAAGAELRRSLDGGLTFAAIHDFSSSGAATLRLAAGPGQTLFVLTAKADAPAELRLFEIHPGQEPIERSLPGPIAWLTPGILATGARPGQLYVSPLFRYGELLWKSADGGRNWTSIWGGQPNSELRALVAAADGESIWILPGEFGIYRARLSSEERLFLARRRFAATATLRGAGGEIRRGRPFFLTDQTGYFSFSSPDRMDFAVKILDGRPLTGAFWVFGASLTDAELDLEVRDLETGEIRLFHHPAGSFASFADFDALSGSAPFAPRSQAASPPAATLSGGRFEVTVDWRDFTGIAFGSGQPQRLDDDTVGFSFFWQQNVELIVRIAGGTPADGYASVSFAALTNVEYFLTVRDTWTGEVWTRHNPLGSFASGIDAAAFPP